MAKNEELFSVTRDKEINWNNLNLSTPAKLHERALSVEEAGQAAVARTIADHKAVGNPIYYTEPDNLDLIIMEMPDGQRFHVELASDGTEIVIDNRKALVAIDPTCASGDAAC